MQVIELEDRKVYRASKGKKVKFVGSDSKFAEIVVEPDDRRQVEEVAE